MIVPLKAHKRIVALLVMISIIGVLVLMRMFLVVGVSTYVNAESKKEDANHQVIGYYYLAQARTGDFMEPYIAYYNAGTSFAKANQPEMAEHLLNVSLSKVDYVYNECYIRHNLAKVQEQLGDYHMISDAPATAETYYAKAKTTIEEAPSVCFPPPPPSGGSGEEQDPNAPQSDSQDGEQSENTSEDGNPLTPQDDEPKDAENGEEMKETEKRAGEKEGEAQEAQGKSGDKKEQIKEEMSQSKSEMSNQEDLAQQQGEEGDQPPTQDDKPKVDKPW